MATKVETNIHEKRQGSPLESGEFNLRQLSIHSPSNPNPVLLDSPTSFIELCLYEDLFSNVLKGTFVFIDTQGLVETLPIIGDETIVITFSTPSGEETSNNLTDNTRTQAEEAKNQRFKVYDIQEVKSQERANFYKLFFISEEYVFSSKMKVSKGYKGKRYSEMVKDVMKKVNSKINSTLHKKLYIEESETMQNVIVPNWSPFQAINFFASRAISGDITPADVSNTTNADAKPKPIGALYFFYEKLGSGFSFESIESMILKQKQQNEIPLYQYTPKLTEGRSSNLGLGFFGVENFEIKSSFKTIENLRRGKFGSKLIAYDPIRMKYEVIKYDYYEKSKEDVFQDSNTGVETISQNPEDLKDDGNRIFSDFIGLDVSSKDRKVNKTISTSSDFLGSNDAVINLFTTSKEHREMFTPPSSESFGTGATAITINPATSIGVKNDTFKDREALENSVEGWLLQRQAQIQEFGSIVVAFTVPGNSARHVGDLIRFEIPSTIPDDSSVSMTSPRINHQLYGGLYVVSRIKHIISRDNYMMDIELIKNSFNVRIPGQETIA